MFDSSLTYRHVFLYVHHFVGTPVVAWLGNFVPVANPRLVGQTKHRFCFTTSEHAMSTTAHLFVIILKPLQQKATSASCHFNVLSIFFMRTFAPHFSEASSLLPTAIGYGSAAKLSLEHVTYNETGKFHPKHSDHWLSCWNPLPVRKKKRTRKTVVGDTCTGALVDLLQPRALSWWFAAGHGTQSPCCGCSGNPYVPHCRSHIGDACVHLSLQTKLNSYIVILQIRGLLYHNFKALKFVLSFSSLFI